MQQKYNILQYLLLPARADFVISTCSSDQFSYCEQIRYLNFTRMKYCKITLWSKPTFVMLGTYTSHKKFATGRLYSYCHIPSTISVPCRSRSECWLCSLFCTVLQVFLDRMHNIDRCTFYLAYTVNMWLQLLWCCAWSSETATEEVLTGLFGECGQVEGFTFFR